MIKGSFVHYFIFLIAAASFQAAAADTLRIHVPEFPVEMNVAASEHPAAVLVRQLAGETLLAARGADGPELRLLKEFSLVPNENAFRIRLLPRHFTNTRPIGEEDVVFSLLFCDRSYQHRHLKTVELEQAARTSSLRSIKVVLDEAVHLRESFEFLSRCPIVDSVTAVLFGEDFGRGSNYVSAGEYQLRSFSEGRSYTLVRSSQFATRTGGFSEIVILGTSDWERALSALRSGESDILMPEPPGGNIVGRAESDSSLGVLKCGGKTVVSRRALQLHCPGFLNVGAAKYTY